MNTPLRFVPRGLNREQSASYVGVGTTKFDEMVADGRMPKPKMIDARRVWDRDKLDVYFDNLADLGKECAEANPFDGVKA
jgi:predicted DNA-binding transcriptional regulator AlpA